MVTAWTAFRDSGLLLITRGDASTAWLHLRAQMSLFTLSNYLTFFMLIGTVLVAVFQTRWKLRLAQAQPGRTEPAPGFPDIEPLEKFDWKTTEPLKIRPFKPKYNLTMDDGQNTALENLNPSELLLMDKNHMDRTALRHQLIRDHYDACVNVQDDDDATKIQQAVHELYTYLFGTYLPGRYPTMFRLERTEYETGKVTTSFLHNLLTDELLPAKASPTKPTRFWLENLGKTIDEDFLLLLPASSKKEKKKENFDESDASYVLAAYIVCFPAGFDTREKLGLKLRDIHGPVPGYKEKLQGSMDRFFARIEVGRYVKRVNWSIMIGDQLFGVDKKSHGYDGDTYEQEDVDIDQASLRCERQTLHRLPASKALVFAFKTYTYPIRQIKKEEEEEKEGSSGHLSLADAIDGLKTGNVPGMHFYKRGAVWGDAIKRYLRS